MLTSTAHRRLLLQIVTESGDVVKIAGNSPLERDLIDVLERKLFTQPINWVARLGGWRWWRARTQTEIDAAIRAELRDALIGAVGEAIRELKSDTRYVWTKAK